jgi:hypothetical protein
MLKGSHHKPESKKKMSVSQREVRKDPVVAKHFSDAAKLRSQTPEARLAVSEQMKEYYEDPWHIEEMSVRTRLYFRDHPEARDRLAEVMRERIAKDPDLPKRMNRAMHEKHNSKPSTLPDVIEI